MDTVLWKEFNRTGIITFSISEKHLGTYHGVKFKDTGEEKLIHEDELEIVNE